MEQIWKHLVLVGIQWQTEELYLFQRHQVNHMHMGQG